MDKLENKISSALGKTRVDLLIKNARVVNVLSGEIHDGDVAVHKGLVLGFGDYEARKITDIKGLFLSPGFIDGHIHLESTMLSPYEFSRTVVPLGTTSVVIDPHEIANVLGADGIRYMLKTGKGLPLDIYIMLPSCVPATDMETSGARLSAGNLLPFIHNKRILGIAEVMNYPAVISRRQDVIEKIRIAKDKRIDGHAPFLSGKELNAYIISGISSDHECTTLNEAREKLQKGMYIMIREGTTEKNLEALLPLVNSKNSRRFFFVSDDRHPQEILRYGHMNHILKKAVSMGLSPVTAIQMAAINTAEYFGIKNIGAIAPGYIADMVVLKDLKEFMPEMVFKDGRIIAEKGKIVIDIKPREIKIKKRMNIRFNGLGVKAAGKRINVIKIIPDQVVTKKILFKPKVENGFVVSDVKRDILKIAVIERHHGTGNIGIGFVKGFGLKKGAIASSVSHDSHNIIVVGTNDNDMIIAIKEVERLNGGYVVAKDGKIISSLQLEIAGLMSSLPINDLCKRFSHAIKKARELGCTLNDPFMTMSFLALPVIPEIKITDKGIVDVKRFKIEDLFE